MFAGRLPADCRQACASSYKNRTTEVRGGNKSDLYTPRVYRGPGKGGGVYIPFGKGYIGFGDFCVFLKILIKPYICLQMEIFQHEWKGNCIICSSVPKSLCKKSTLNEKIYIFEAHI